MTAKKKAVSKKKKVEKKTRQGPYEWCEEEIVLKVIAPRIINLLAEFQPTSKQEMRALMKEHYGATVSDRILAKWLDIMGLKPKRLTYFDSSGAHPALLAPSEPETGGPERVEPETDDAEFTDEDLKSLGLTEGTTPAAVSGRPEPTPPPQQRVVGNPEALEAVFDNRARSANPVAAGANQDAGGIVTS